MADPHPGVKIFIFDKELEFAHDAGAEVCKIPCPEDYDLSKLKHSELKNLNQSNLNSNNNSFQNNEPS